MFGRNVVDPNYGSQNSVIHVAIGMYTKSATEKPEDSFRERLWRDDPSYTGKVRTIEMEGMLTRKGKGLVEWRK